MSDQEYEQDDFDQENKEDNEEQQENDENEQNDQEQKQDEKDDNQQNEENDQQEDQNQEDQENEQQQENQSNAQLSNNQKSENQSQVEESQVEQSVNQQEDVNLQSIDAVSVKITKEDKKQSSKTTKKNGKVSGQQQMVNDLMKKHKEKQKKMQQREDEIYVQEKIQKQLPKPQNKPKVVTKQKLVFDKETKAKLEDPKIDNQQKAAILTKDLAKKLDKPIVVKDKPKQIEIKKPGKGSEAKPKVNLFDVRIGAGIPSKLDQDVDDKASKDLVKERNAFLEQKKREKEQAIKFQEEQDALLKQKQNDARKQQQKAFDRENKILQQNTEKIEEKKYMMQAQKQEKQLAKQEDDKDQIRKDLDILKGLQRENKSLKNEMDSQEQEILKITKEIELLSRHENVIQINGEYKSLRKIRMKEGLDGFSTEMVSQQQSQILGAQMPDEDQIAIKVSNEIAKNDLKLNDAYALLDEDKDGALTTKEIQNNISRLNLNLTEYEIQQFIKMIDSNSDGVLTEQEFVQFLTPSLENQKQYIKIMGDIKDILNPIVLEERRLHLKYLMKYLNKEIEEEKQKEIDRKPEYNKYIKKLKKTEMLIEALQGTTSDKGKLKQQCEQLRQELRQIQDKRNKITVDLREKKKMITENIESLMQDLGTRSQQVIEAKEQLNKAQIQSQRVEIKLISLQQIREKYQKELQQKNEIEIRGGKTQAKLQQLRFDMEKKSLKEKTDEVQFLHYLIIVQKCTRGFIFKRRLQKKLKGLKGCAQIVFNLLQKKIKQAKLKGIYALEENLKQIKKEEEERKKQEILRQQEQKKKFIKDKRKMQNYVTAQFTKPSQPQPLTLLEEQLQILPKVITIQKVFRQKYSNILMTDKAVNVYFGLGNNENCQICRTDIAEVICKVCEKPVLCDSCYRINHKNYKKRNHGFYVIIKAEKLIEQNKNMNTIFSKVDQDEVLSN